MGYCFNCGQRITDHDKFCESCGTLLEEATCCEAKSSSNTRKKGYLFTNIGALSQKFNIGSDRLTNLLLSFIEEKKAFGVDYFLINVGDYTPMLTINKGRGKIKLSPLEPWETHQRLLTDRYVYDTEHNSLDIDYLFIIGGHDIIPMPSVPNYISDNDPTVDTDIPYGYLYGTQTQPLLESGALFHHAPMLHVGRLPFAADAVYEDITNYLERNLSVSENGFPKSSFYGQCDPHWKRVSTLATDFLSSTNNVSDDLKNYCYGSLILSPGVTITEEEYHPLLEHETLHVSRFFDEEAVIYYFNMHGSNYPSSPYFVGEIYPSTRNYLPGISPRNIEEATLPNIVVTEACYGARFIDATADDSMLLSAMRTSTMVYVGSSRTSLGQVDGAEGQEVYLSCADTIANSFINYFLSGADAAQALFVGRQQVLAQIPNGAEAYMTVIEFNLFGDPTLTFDSSANDIQNKVNSEYKSINQQQTLMKEEDYSEMQIKSISITENDSILNRVRNAVNLNINNINKEISEHLYKQYNIRPRKLNQIFEINIKNEKDHLYIYEKDDISQIWVTINQKNNIKRVLTTK